MAIGLPFHAAQIISLDAVRMGWAWYVDGGAVVMVSLFASPDAAAWRDYVHDDTGEAVRTEAVVAGHPVTWVTRPDRSHYILAERAGVRVTLGGNLPAERLRGLAAATLG